MEDDDDTASSTSHDSGINDGDDVTLTDSQSNLSKRKGEVAAMSVDDSVTSPQSKKVKTSNSDVSPSKLRKTKRS